jgi:hypothetical protein
MAAPTVVDQMSIGEHSRVLVSGWRREAFRRALSRRWGHLILDDGDFFLASAPISQVPAGPYDAIVLSGLLPCYPREEVPRILASSAKVVNERGVLVMHDALAPTDSFPAPEIVLEALGRHVAWGTDTDWSVEQLRAALKDLRFGDVHVRPLPVGTMVVMARKGPAPSVSG